MIESDAYLHAVMGGEFRQALQLAGVPCARLFDEYVQAAPRAARAIVACASGVVAMITTSMSLRCSTSCQLVPNVQPGLEAASRVALDASESTQ